VARTRAIVPTRTQRSSHPLPCLPVEQSSKFEGYGRLSEIATTYCSFAVRKLGPVKDKGNRLAKVFNEGFRAFVNGLPRDACPYECASEERRAWHAGYDEAAGMAGQE
jgi:ribosome modulation factor